MFGDDHVRQSLQSTAEPLADGPWVELDLPFEDDKPDWMLDGYPEDRAQYYGVPTAEEAQRLEGEAMELGVGTWADELVADVAAVIGAESTDTLRSELAVLADTATQWRQAIDARHRRGAA